MLAAGIPDPAKVTRSALQNAASIAALFLTTEAVIADKPGKAVPMPGDDGARRARISIPPRSPERHTTPPAQWARRRLRIDQPIRRPRRTR